VHRVRAAFKKCAQSIKRDFSREEGSARMSSCPVGVCVGGGVAHFRCAIVLLPSHFDWNPPWHVSGGAPPWIDQCLGSRVGDIDSKLWG